MSVPIGPAAGLSPGEAEAMLASFSEQYPAVAEAASNVRLMAGPEPLPSVSLATAEELTAHLAALESAAAAAATLASVRAASVQASAVTCGKFLELRIRAVRAELASR